MKKTFLKLIIPLLITSLFSGCAISMEIDNLLSPPTLSVEQEQIYSALTDTTGTTINLKYPKSGKYLSAFIIENLDGDSENEAIVFYEKQGLTVDENTLRINVLDQFDGVWQSVCDTSAEGSDIEKVIISQLGENDRVNILIGNSLINKSEKSVAIYTYENGLIEKTFSSSCSYMDVIDLDGDETNEVLLLHNSSENSPSKATTYKLDDEGLYHLYQTDLNGSFTEFDKIVYGDIGNERVGFYIDAVSSSGTIQTDILFMDENGLQSAFKSVETSTMTLRPSGLNTSDIDNDGIYEIPIQTQFIGYNDVPESEQIFMTEWYYFNGENLVKKYSSYSNISDGYVFLLPERWIGNVTVVRDAINEELVFCAYSEENGVGEELLRIFTADDSASKDDHILSGYQLIRTKGNVSYMALVVDNSDSSLKLSSGETALYFKFPN